MQFIVSYLSYGFPFSLFPIPNSNEVEYRSKSISKLKYIITSHEIFFENPKCCRNSRSVVGPTFYIIICRA